MGDDGAEAAIARPSLIQRWRQRARAGLRSLGDLVVPPTCLVCREMLVDADALCPTCWREIAFIRPPLCRRLGIPLPYGTGDLLSARAVAEPPDYDRARFVAHFDGVMRDLVHGFKYSDRHDARRLFGRWMAEAGRDVVADAEVVVPVPLAWTRLVWRRFNQAAILGQDLARARGVPFAPLALRRTRKTPSQVGLSRDQRRRNVAGAFAVPPRRAAEIAGRRVLLVDDVVTTGSTVEACARALRRAGAREVDVVALALATDDAVR